MKWRINFTIPNTNFNLIAYATSEFIKELPRKDGVQLFREWILEYKDGLSIAYIPVEVIETVSIWIRDKIIAEPEWAEKLHKENEETNWNYFNYAHSLVDVDLTKLSNEELWKIYSKLREHQLHGHTDAIATTWFLDSDKEIFSNYLRQELNKWLADIGIEDPTKQIEYFILLTTPDRENLAMKEQVEFLELVKYAKEKGYTAETEQRVLEYYKKWCWTPYGYIGPAYDLKYYQDQLEQTVAKVENVNILINEEKARGGKIKGSREKLEKDIKLPENLQVLFKIARDIIWLKDFRKYTIFYGHYILDKLTKEIARRLNLSHRQANHFLTEEGKKALLFNEYDEHLLNERINYCVMWANENETRYFYGDEAYKMMKNLEVEEVNSVTVDGFKGTTACPGKVQGEVKIVMGVGDLGKVRPGDVLLAITTYPSFLPAMKKAAAIVTEDGGITCHAAIVAREFKIPCVVGVRGIIKSLKDGDVIRVDATLGEVNKI